VLHSFPTRRSSDLHVAIYGLFEPPWIIDLNIIIQFICHGNKLTSNTLLLGPRLYNFNILDIWENILLKKEPLNNYFTIFKGVQRNNLIWWGTKKAMLL